MHGGRDGCDEQPSLAITGLIGKKRENTMHVSTFLGSGTSFRSDQAIFADGDLGCGGCPCRIDTLARVVVVAGSPSRVAYAEPAGPRVPMRLGSGERNAGVGLPRHMGTREKTGPARCGGGRQSVFFAADRSGGSLGSARLVVYGSGTPIAHAIVEAVHELQEPFVFRWNKSGRWPWQWTLTGFSQEELVARYPR